MADSAFLCFRAKFYEEGWSDHLRYKLQTLTDLRLSPEQIDYARVLGEAAHGIEGQTYDGQPYTYHTKYVAQVASRFVSRGMLQLEQQIPAARAATIEQLSKCRDILLEFVTAISLLHDVVEDTPVSTEHIIDLLGPIVGTGVALCTDPEFEFKANRKTKKAVACAFYSSAESVAHKLLAPHFDYLPEWVVALAVDLGFIAKLSDRIANVESCVENEDSRLAMYEKENDAFLGAIKRPRNEESFAPLYDRITAQLTGGLS